MRKETRWPTSSKDTADVPRGDGRWKHDRGHVRMTEQASEYLASLLEAIMGAIKQQMILDGAIKVGSDR